MGTSRFYRTRATWPRPAPMMLLMHRVSSFSWAEASLMKAQCIPRIRPSFRDSDTVLRFRRFKLKNVGRGVCRSSFLERLFYFMLVRSIEGRSCTIRCTVGLLSEQSVLGPRPLIKSGTHNRLVRDIRIWLNFWRWACSHVQKTPTQLVRAIEAMVLCPYMDIHGGMSGKPCLSLLENKQLGMAKWLLNYISHSINLVSKLGQETLYKCKIV